jgi:hypothetical protein
MKNNFLIIFILFALFQSCVSWKSGLKKQGDYNTAINNAILDFRNTTYLVKRDNAFFVDYKELNEGLIQISIKGNIGKFIITANGQSSRFPTKYIEYKGKLFYWYDKNYPFNEKVIYKFDEYGLVDSVETVADAIFVNDDSKKGMNYYFCKNNMIEYKKMRTSRIMSTFQELKLKCD